jgi:hypothetical protein
MIKKGESREYLDKEKIKDFFIPNPNNNYKPRSLRQERLLFYAISALAIKILLFILVFFYPVTAWMTPDVSFEESRKIIALTNELRSRLNLSPLSESSRLNQAAYNKVQDMLINQYFAHLSPQGFNLEHFLKLAAYNNYITVGENLGMGYDNALELVTAWKNSPTHYNNLVDSNFREIGVALIGGEYKKINTVFSAQYFGLSKDEFIPLEKEAVETKVIEPSTSAGPRIVLSEKIDSVTSPTVIELIPIAPKVELDVERLEAKVIIDEPVGAKQDSLVKVEITLPPEVINAKLQVLNTEVQLLPVACALDPESEDKKWIGQTIFQNSAKSAAPPVISLSTRSGEIKHIDISDNNIKAKQSSIMSQYWLFKNQPNRDLAQIFDISSMYFNFLLVFVIIATILNIFIARKNQHPKVLISSFALILFLVLLIIF